MKENTMIGRTTGGVTDGEIVHAENTEEGYQAYMRARCPIHHVYVSRKMV